MMMAIWEGTVFPSGESESFGGTLSVTALTPGNNENKRLYEIQIRRERARAAKPA
jgi:hypothetical protein